MLKKTLAIYVFILAAVLYFHIDVSTLTEQAVRQIRQEEEKPSPPPVGTITPTTLVESGRTVNIYDSEETVAKNFGEAKACFPSEYGFLWYAFHQDWNHYLQIGIDEENTVCALYSNSPAFEFCGLRVGSTLDEVRMTLGEPLTAIQKGDVIYQLNCGNGEKRETDVFLFHHMYVRFFYDCFKNNTVTSIHIIEEDTELAFQRQYAEGTEELARALETENFCVTNALRVREGLSPVLWSEQAHEAALAHAQDMAQNNYFSHTDRNGGSVADRVRAVGLKVSRVAENLAAGGQNGNLMHELLMNSQGHRKNILGQYQFLGVGVAFGEDNRPYLTQNYYIPRVTAAQ